METSRIIQFFGGSAYAVERATKISRSTVLRWGRWVPHKYHERIVAAIQAKQRKLEQVREVVRSLP